MKKGGASNPLFWQRGTVQSPPLKKGGQGGFGRVTGCWQAINIGTHEMVKVRDILTWIDACAPFRYAASWDNSGLQVGDPDARVTRVLVALDPTEQVLSEADERGCECVVSHHPLIFQPLHAVRVDKYPGNLVSLAIKKGIHLIAAHTNLDAAREGTNDQLARLLSLETAGSLEVDDAWLQERLYGGFGRLGRLDRPVSLGTLVQEIGRALGESGIRVVGDYGRQVQQVALCSGSGGSLIEAAIASGSDVYVTGDIKYHEARRALDAGLALIDIGHFASERLVIEPLADTLRSRATDNRLQLDVLVALKESDPFQFWTER